MTLENDIAEFTRSDSMLTTGRVAVEHREKFVAAYAGKIVASEADLVTLTERLKYLGIPLAITAIRYIEADGREAE